MTTIDEAISVLENPYVKLHIVRREGDDPDYWRKLKPTRELAIATLREKQERENPEPLTLEELREMEGQPVWLHTFSPVKKKTNIAQWAILESVCSANAVFLRAGINSRLTEWFANYGTRWLAYRTKPKEGLK